MKAAEVANGVNAWAEKQTKGVIKEVLPSGAVDNTTKLVFANALYFKGAWNEKFDASATKDHDFHLSSGSSIKVPFMTSKKKQFVSHLKGLGLVLPFSNEADLTEMVESSVVGSNLSVSSIFHQSFIEVNEQGTEAGAASVGVIALRGLPAEKIDFVADHPFMFLIKEDLTGMVLFSGHIVDPSQAS
ncbi:unnamed protein product [Linum tenue]|uniref:Serpin domain-containing protein n=1 Tax=Linum tenue TaxID=586396 RepID=A0AAV0RPS1_9ROSI|nr:unnamed protein product [Linum tenue]